MDEVRTDLWILTKSDLQSAAYLYLEPIQSAQTAIVAHPLFFLSIAMILGIAMSGEFSFVSVRKHPIIAVPLFLGVLSSIALIRESSISRRNLVAKVCFAAAGVVLLMETLLLLVK